MLQYSDSVKTSLKLELLSGQHNDTRHEDYLLDLGKALYKLHFQLLLLIEAANKMISTLNITLKSIQVGRRVNFVNYPLTTIPIENINSIIVKRRHS